MVATHTLRGSFTALLMANRLGASSGVEAKTRRLASDDGMQAAVFRVPAGYTTRLARMHPTHPAADNLPESDAHGARLRGLARSTACLRSSIS